jgi:hypothetical protein
MSQHFKAVRPEHIDPCDNLKDVGCHGGAPDNIKDVCF